MTSEEWDSSTLSTTISDASLVSLQINVEEKITATISTYFGCGRTGPTMLKYSNNTNITNINRGQVQVPSENLSQDIIRSIIRAEMTSFMTQQSPQPHPAAAAVLLNSPSDIEVNIESNDPKSNVPQDMIRGIIKADIALFMTRLRLNQDMQAGSSNKTAEMEENKCRIIHKAASEHYDSADADADVVNSTRSDFVDEISKMDTTNDFDTTSKQGIGGKSKSLFRKFKHATTSVLTRNKAECYSKSSDAQETDRVLDDYVFKGSMRDADVKATASDVLEMISKEGGEDCDGVNQKIGDEINQKRSKSILHNFKNAATLALTRIASKRNAELDSKSPDTEGDDRASDDFLYDSTTSDADVNSKVNDVFEDEMDNFDESNQKMSKSILRKFNNATTLILKKITSNNKTELDSTSPDAQADDRVPDVYLFDSLSDASVNLSVSDVFDTIFKEEGDDLDSNQKKSKSILHKFKNATNSVLAKLASKKSAELDSKSPAAQEDDPVTDAESTYSDSASCEETSVALMPPLANDVATFATEFDSKSPAAQEDDPVIDVESTSSDSVAIMTPVGNDVAIFDTSSDVQSQSALASFSGRVVSVTSLGDKFSTRISSTKAIRIFDMSSPGLDVQHEPAEKNKTSSVVEVIQTARLQRSDTDKLASKVNKFSTKAIHIFDMSAPGKDFHHHPVQKDTKVEKLSRAEAIQAMRLMDTERLYRKISDIPTKAFHAFDNMSSNGKNFQRRTLELDDSSRWIFSDPATGNKRYGGRKLITRRSNSIVSEQE
jgi:hypothetical protein